MIHFLLSILVSNVAPKHRKARSRDFENTDLEHSCLSRRSAPGYELVTCRKAAACSPMKMQCVHCWTRQRAVKVAKRSEETFDPDRKTAQMRCRSQVIFPKVLPTGALPSLD
jgi:hypothetical protein